MPSRPAGAIAPEGIQQAKQNQEGAGQAGAGSSDGAAHEGSQTDDQAHAPQHRQQSRADTDQRDLEPGRSRETMERLLRPGRQKGKSEKVRRQGENGVSAPK